MTQQYHPKPLEKDPLVLRVRLKRLRNAIVDALPLISSEEAKAILEVALERSSIYEVTPE